MIPPWNFLGDEEEMKIIRCYSSYKGTFSRQQHSTTTATPVPTLHVTLTAQEKCEVEE